MQTLDKVEENWLKNFNGKRSESNPKILEGYYVRDNTKEKIAVKLNLTLYWNLKQLSDKIKNLKKQTIPISSDELQKLIYSWNSSQHGSSLDGADISNFDLSSIDNSPGKSLQLDCSFIKCTASSTRFNNSNLSGSNFMDASLENADFSLSSLVNSLFNSTKAQGANFTSSDFTNADLTNTNFSQARLAYANFDRAITDNMFYIPSTEDSQEKVNLYGANFSNIRVSPSVMSMIEYNITSPHNDIKRIIKDRVKEWKDSYNGIEIENSILKSTHRHNSTTHEIRLDVKAYSEIMTLSYNIERANIISDNLESDKKKHELITRFNCCHDHKSSDNRVLLQGADLSECDFYPNYKTQFYRNKATTCDFSDFDFSNSNLYRTNFSNTIFCRSIFNDSRIELATFDNSIMTKTQLTNSKIEFSSFKYANLDDSNISNSNIRLVSFDNSSFNSCICCNTNIESTSFTSCIWEEMRINNSQFINSNLTDTYYKPSLNDDLSKILFEQSNIEVAQFPQDVMSFIIYNRKKSQWDKWFKRTNNTTKPSSMLNFEAKISDSFLSPILPKNWENHALGYIVTPILYPIYHTLALLVYFFTDGITWLFWQSTNYGYSTTRIIKSFVYISLIFAILYFTFGDNILKLSSHEIQSNPINLSEKSFKVQDYSEGEYTIKKFAKCCYFSIVTMTTLGFGDITAKEDSLLGYIIISTHVILGYITLGALITRFGTLFSSHGPTTTPQKYKQAHATGKTPHINIIINGKIVNNNQFGFEPRPPSKSAFPRA